jgi:hypothetical protein
VSFAAVTLCVASQQVFVVVCFVIDSVRKLLDTPSRVSNGILSIRPDNTGCNRFPEFAAQYEPKG